MALSVNAYAKHRAAKKLSGGTPKAVRDAILAGRLKASVTRDRKIRDVEKADAEWAANTLANRVPQTGPTAPDLGEREPTNDLGAARARRETANASMAEIELGRARGELVLARDVEARIGDWVLKCRTRLLGMVVRARQQDPTLTETQLKLVEALLYEALEELAGGPRE